MLPPELVENLVEIAPKLRRAGVLRFSYSQGRLDVELAPETMPLDPGAHVDSTLPEALAPAPDPRLCVRCQAAPRGWHSTQYCKNCGRAAAGLGAT